MEHLQARPSAHMAPDRRFTYCQRNAILRHDGLREGALIVKFARPEHSKGAVNRAGNVLRDGAASSKELEESLNVINNWRASHSFPLQVIKMMLKNRARVVDPNATVSQRLKRLSSIRAKLIRAQTSHMELARMQDIGGCRAVVLDIESLDQLALAFRKGFAKNPVGRHALVGKVDDHVSEPKADGYRGIHYPFRYVGRSSESEIYNGHRIEIQIRTRLQHAWATAVETVDTLTRQSLKFALNSNVGDENWKRFFALMGSVLAIEEDKPLVPGTPSDRKVLHEELWAMAERTSVEQVLGGLQTVVHVSADPVWEDQQEYLLILNSATKQVQIKAFPANLIHLVEKEYAQIERENDPDIQVVQVSVDDVRLLKLAFPNYYLDTTVFLGALRKAILEHGH